MKRLILAALLFAAGCVAYEPPREIGMSSEYTPNPANNPATITMPGDGDLVVAESVNNGLRDLADKDSRKIDAVAGGTYTPGAPIVIAGSGLTTSGTANLNGFVNVNGVVTINNTSQFNGGLIEVFTGSTLQGDAGSILDWAGSASISGAAAFTGTTTLGGVTSVDVSLTIDGGSSAQLALTAGSSFSCNAPLTFTGAGHPVYRYGFGVTYNANISFGVNDVDVVVAKSGSLSATRNWTVLNTGAVRGAVIEIANDDFAAQRVDIFQHDGTTLIASLGSAFDYFAVKLINDGAASASSSWQILSATHVP